MANNKAYFDLQNEGGEGFGAADMVDEQAAYKKCVAEYNTKFNAEWTAEVTKSRREIWNQEVKACGKTVTQKQFIAITDKLGFSLFDLKKAVAMHNL